MERRNERTRVLGRDQPHVDAEPALERHPLLEPGEVVAIRDEKEIADLPVAGIETELLDEALEDRDGLQREADLRLGRELSADATRRLGRGAGPDGVALDDEHVAQATERQVIGEAAADDTATDDDDVSRARERHTGRGQSPATRLA